MLLWLKTQRVLTARENPRQLLLQPLIERSYFLNAK